MRMHPGALSTAVSMSETTVSAVHGPATGTTESAPPESFSMPHAIPAADVPAEATPGATRRSDV